IVHYMNRMSQSQTASESSALGRLALKAQAASKSSLGLDLKMRSQKGSGELGLNMQGPKTAKAPGSGAGGDQKSGELIWASVQAASSQELNLQALNLQSVKNGASVAGGRRDRDLAKGGSAGTQEGHAESRKPSALSEVSTGEDTSSDSDRDSASFPGVGQNMSVSIQTSQDWKPTRSLIEHVFVTDVTANLITVTVKESPTSVGFFNLRQY
ncbi:Chromobox protein 2, partial [Manacus vitellinus]